uniref:Uncharacterized protein n=1 Tax=Anguilla anguilla TaxID=7936 RepID=A0A0E9QDT7_ANGAN
MISTFTSERAFPDPGGGWGHGV